MTTTDRPDAGIDMFDPAAIARPHQYYKGLRQNTPIIWSQQMNGWVLTRFNDIRPVLRDSEHWSAEQRDGTLRREDLHVEEMTPPSTKTMLTADAPDHTRLRKLLDRDFTPSRINRLVPHVEEVTKKLVEGASKRDTFDVAQELSAPLPTIVIAELLGVDPGQYPQFKRWSDATTAPVRPNSTQEEVDVRNKSIVEFRTYLQERIDERHRNPTDDFIGRLVQAHDDEERLSDNELLAAVHLLLVAGNETTTNLISNATLALWKFPDQQQKLRDNPALIDDAIEEFIRYDNSVQFTMRRALAPAEFYGQEVATGESVMLILASGNRDETVFENPDVLDFERPRVRNLGFGDWIHVCIGQYLARIETKAAILALLDEFPRFELAVPEDEIIYRPNFNLRGPKHLPIKPA